MGRKISFASKKKLTDKDWLYNQYVTEHNSCQKIAEIAVCDDLTIRYWLMKYDIPLRSNSEAIIGIYNPFYGRKHSPETLKHFSDIRLGEKNPNYGIPLSDEQKQQISKTLTGKYVGENSPSFGLKRSPETLERMSVGRKGKYTGPANSMYGRHHKLHAKQLISEKSKIYWSVPENRENLLSVLQSDEQREKLSDIAAEHWKLGVYDKRPMHTRSKCCWFKAANGNSYYLKSSYEIRVATMLDKLGIEWDYESQYFDIEDRTYRPDFYIKDIDAWWEVKGWLDKNDKVKMEKFFKYHPDVTLRMVWLDDIKQLETFSESIDLYDIINIGYSNLNCDEYGKVVNDLCH